MKLARRKFLHLAAGVAALPAVSRAAMAQTYPARPITLIVPLAVGGVNDVVGRIVAEGMRKSLGQPVIIENVSGAEGSIGTGRVARAKPDGYTIDLGANSTHVLNAALYSLPYDVFDDFQPLSPLVATPVVLLARKSIPAHNLKDLIAWIKANPNQAAVGIGNPVAHLLTVLFGKETKTQFVFVPYRGGGPAMQDLVAGQIDLLFTTPEKLPLVQSGSIKAYAVTSDMRMALAPDVPTFGEIGFPALSFSIWFGLFAPKVTPKEINGRLNAAAVEALADPVVHSRLVDLGMQIFPREQQTPEALGVMVKADAEKWWPIIKELGIKAGSPNAP